MIPHLGLTMLMLKQKKFTPGCGRPKSSAYRPIFPNLRQAASSEQTTVATAPTVLPSTPIIFPITKLPMELQMLVLEACLIRPTPLVNIYRTLPFKLRRLVLRIRDEPDSDLSLNIMFTCRLYWHEGMRMLHTKNRFLFSGTRVGIPVARPDDP